MIKSFLRWVGQVAVSFFVLSVFREWLSEWQAERRAVIDVCLQRCVAIHQQDRIQGINLLVAGKVFPEIRTGSELRRLCAMLEKAKCGNPVTFLEDFMPPSDFYAFVRSVAAASRPRKLEYEGVNIPGHKAHNIRSLLDAESWRVKHGYPIKRS